jgi:hypothetical protein
MIPQPNTNVFSAVLKHITQFCCTKFAQTVPQPFAKTQIPFFCLENHLIYEV